MGTKLEYKVNISVVLRLSEVAHIEFETVHFDLISCNKGHFSKLLIITLYLPIIFIQYIMIINRFVVDYELLPSLC